MKIEIENDKLVKAILTVAGIVILILVCIWVYTTSVSISNLQRDVADLNRTQQFSSVITNVLANSFEIVCLPTANSSCGMRVLALKQG